MILALLLTLAAMVFGFVIFLIVMPLEIHLSVGFKGFQFFGSGICSLLHPRFLAFHFDFESKKGTVRIFSKAFKKRKKKSAPEATDDTSSSSSPDENEDEVEATESGQLENETYTPLASDEPSGQRDDETGIGETEKEVSKESGLNEMDTDIKETEESIDKEKENTIEKPSVDRSSYHISTEEEMSNNLSNNRETPKIKTSSKKKKTDEKVAESPQKKDNWFKRLLHSRYLFFLKNKRWRNKVIRWIIRVIRSLFTIITFDRFQFFLRAGIENPMVVGTLFGLYRAARSALPMNKPYFIEYEPVFMKNYCEGTMRFRTATSLFRVLLPVIMALFTFPIIHSAWLWWSFSRMEKRRKQLAVT